MALDNWVPTYLAVRCVLCGWSFNIRSISTNIPECPRCGGRDLQYGEWKWPELKLSDSTHETSVSS